jgi:hypothetical protein
MSIISCLSPFNHNRPSTLRILSADPLVRAYCSPGRWMASALMKLVIAQLLTRFDILPADGDSSRGSLIGSLSFEEFYVPNFGLKVRLRHKE